MENNTYEDTLMADKVEFAVIAIEATAQQMGILPRELRRRLERVNLIQNFIFEFYDTLHTQSRQYVADVVEEALNNWELRENNSHVQAKDADAREGVGLC